MVAFVRTKSPTDPLHDKVKARLRGDEHSATSSYSSSGSDHDADDDLALLLQDDSYPDVFSDAASGTGGCDDDGSDEEQLSKAWDIVSVLGNADSYRAALVSKVYEAIASVEVSELTANKRLVYNHAVMGRLREEGYDAGLCKSRWEKGPNITAGSYEYIDVVISTTGRRYIIDLYFAGEFEIARAREEYLKTVESLPKLMVATAGEVRRIVRAVAAAAKTSLRRVGMEVPPWRRTDYMIAKWFGPYRRITNPLLMLTGGTMVAGAEVKCRAVGFRSTSNSVTYC